MQRIRHLDVRYLWLQDEVAHKRLVLRKCRGDENIADGGTKPVDIATLTMCRKGFCLRTGPSSIWKGVLTSATLMNMVGADQTTNEEQTTIEEFQGYSTIIVRLDLLR